MIMAVENEIDTLLGKLDTQIAAYNIDETATASEAQQEEAMGIVCFLGFDRASDWMKGLARDRMKKIRDEAVDKNSKAVYKLDFIPEDQVLNLFESILNDLSMRKLSDGYVLLPDTMGASLVYVAHKNNRLDDLIDALSLVNEKYAQDILLTKITLDVVMRVRTDPDLSLAVLASMFEVDNTLQEVPYKTYAEKYLPGQDSTYKQLREHFSRGPSVLFYGDVKLPVPRPTENAP